MIFEIFYCCLILYSIGIVGVFSKKSSIFVVFICIELIIFAVEINFIIFSLFLDDILGQIFAIFTLTLTAAESAIGLAILVLYYRRHSSIEFSDQGSLRY